MNAAALIVRELRVEARRGANYWLRVLAAGVLILTFASIMVAAPPDPAAWGATLFAGLNLTLLYAVWILVPLMTADCISREKREGTLGLLFLTPLTVLDVIASKVAIHALRALTLFLAAVPLVGLPLIFGGVDWRWVLVAAVGQANAVLLAIAAGIYASTRGGTAIQVMVRAEAYALGLAVLSAFGSWFLAQAVPGIWMGSVWLASLVGGSIICSLVLFALMLLVSVRRLRRTWQQESAALEQPLWLLLFSTSDFWQAFFHWDKSRTLDRNPVAWLQEYSWTARLTKWGWFVLVLLVEFVVFVWDGSYRSPLWQPAVILALGLGIAFSAVASFRREQETGLLELLLVTPLSERHLLRGRFWGICCHYLPAVAALGVGWFGDRLLNPKFYSNGLMAVMFPNPLAFVSMMVLGLYLALGRLNFFVAWLTTWIGGFFLPGLAAVGLSRFVDPRLPVALGLSSAFQIGLAALLWFLLYRKVHQREFVVGKRQLPLI
jgi:ABC-type transport system involved in multi-copper enzyme maturation permease subunit